MSAALIKAIDDLLDFISAFREGFDLLEGEKQQHFAELDRAVWLSARRLNLQAELPWQRPGDVHLGHTNLPGINRFGALVLFFLSDWKTALADLRAIAATQLLAESLPARETGGSGQRWRNGRGRPANTDPQQDKLIWEAWHTHHYRTFQQLADELKMSKHEVELAIIRERKRRNK